MNIHLVTDRFCTGGGLEHIYQVARGVGDAHFTVFGLPGSTDAADKLSGLSNVTVIDRGFDPGIVLTGEPDLVHIHHLRPLFSFFSNPLKRYDMPILFTAHGLHLHKYEFLPSWTAAVKYRMRFQLEKRLLRRTNRVIAVSREDKEFMESRYGLGNVTYLANGIAPVNRQERSRKESRRRLGFPEDALVFFTAARFHFQKGYDILLDAIFRIRNRLKQKEVLFAWAGEGEEFDMIKDRAQALGLMPFICLLGNRNDVPDIMEAADIFLLPSRWEGLPIVLLEAGLHNLPVLASDTYGNREIIGSSNGILFKNLDSADLAAKITSILDGACQLTLLAGNLHREVQKHYSLERMVSNLRELYSALLSR